MMAALQSEPAMQQQQQDNSSPNVTLTIRLIMQGKVSIEFLKLLFCFVPQHTNSFSFPLNLCELNCLPSEKLLSNMNTHCLYPHHQVALASKLDDPLSYANNI